MIKENFIMMSTISKVVKRYPLVTFLVLTYGLTWASLPLIGQLVYGPTLAAIIVLAFSEGKAGLKALFRQATHWRVGWIWYLIAPGIIVAFNFGGVGLNLLLGAQISPSHELFSVAYFLEGVIFVLLLGGLWEEPGWTGYALPRLRVGRSLLLASLILAVFRTMWHLPLFLGGDIPWSDIVLNFAAQIFISWLYYRTNRSLLIVMLFHFSSNYFGGGIASQLFEGGANIQFAWLQTGLACLIALGLIIFDRQLWFAPASPAQPEVVSEPAVGV
jgi:membrane protease YdiL (CAAX protease family)